MREFKSLTRRGRALRYRRALVQALKKYTIDVTSLKAISSDSKPVYRVYTEKCCYAAKYHNPAEHVLSQMVGEMQFLDHIANHTELQVERPLSNELGDFVTEVKSSWLPAPVHIALSSWLPGRHLRNFISVHSYHHLGRCSALLHDASLTFRPSREFNILTNNQVFYWDQETILSRCDRKLLPKRRKDLFAEGAQTAEEAIRKLWKSGEPIVIHNDLHPSNVKVHRGALQLYDFEDICWGFPQQDIGTAMYHIRFEDNYQELRSAFQAGYEQLSSWPFDADTHLDQFVIARLLMFANYVVNYNIRPVEHLPGFETKLRMLMH
jgi:Ser/Thr protein kinase RdoA (MazF antagonist)